MAKLIVGSVETRQDDQGYKVNIEIEPESDEETPFPNIIGQVTIYIKGNNQELVKKIESQVKRTIKAHGKATKK